MFDSATYLRALSADEFSDLLGMTLIEPVHFENPALAWKRLRHLAESPAQRESLSRALPALLAVLEEAATPDVSLINLDRYLKIVPDRSHALEYLSENPRAVEILVRLFVGSQYLTDVLLQHPEYLNLLTQHNRLAEIKSRPQFYEEGLLDAERELDWSSRVNAIKLFQKRELLRIAACDKFGLLNLKVVTLQLSLLADSIVQLILHISREGLPESDDDFCVLAMGKLGGEELNYSSDIDLVFVGREDGSRHVQLAQRLIRGLSERTSAGFLYRVDMRLRPWGRAGALVTTKHAYLDYLRKDGRLWEKQALLKARPIAGNLSLGEEVLSQLRPLVFQVDPEATRKNVLEMKQEIEARLATQGLLESEIKGGRGGIRDVEFTVQFLQQVSGGQNPAVASINTLDGIVRLAEHDVIQADEYRQLTSGYSFLRTVEHSLQLLNNQQAHTLPTSQRELAYLARRIDFPGTQEFMEYHDRHRAAIRRIFMKYVGHDLAAHTVLLPPPTTSQLLGGHLPGYQELFTESQQHNHLRLLTTLTALKRVKVQGVPLDDHRWEVTIVGFDEPGELSVICGLLLSHGMNIVSGDIFTGYQTIRTGMELQTGRLFIDVFQVQANQSISPQEYWKRFESDLESIIVEPHPSARSAQQVRLARRVANLVEFEPEAEATPLLPLVIEVDNDHDPDVTVLRIAGEDTIGFLYELTNALSLCGILIRRVTIRTTQTQVTDTLYVTDEFERKITDPHHLKELRSAVTLIRHFTHLLPHAPNPEAALLHFRALLKRLFSNPDWAEHIESLDRSEVLGALSRLLGVSDFLSEELLRQEVTRVLPILTDSSLRQDAKASSQLMSELDQELKGAVSLDQQRTILNGFKEREMLRVDMRHVLGQQESMTGFSLELSDIADVVLQATLVISQKELHSQFGVPTLSSGDACRITVCTLGKCAGRELGFASDIELMFLYQGEGRTSGPESISNEEYFDRLTDRFVKTSQSRRKGIFEIDLRLRPHGRAGSRAVTLESFRRYFSSSGPAWPFERQSLVKLRPTAGDIGFGGEILALRDELIYTGTAFDVAAMRALRDKQIRQLVTPGTFHAKLSPGGLVDIEYLVQGLQLIHGGRFPSVRTPNTREAMKALEAVGAMTAEQRLLLRDAHRFMRRLIDALRMVRGDATDLTVPARQTEEHRLLARRMRLFKDSFDLSADIESYSTMVQELALSLLPDVSR